ncbi:mannose-P-dolichol utilization defect 1 protein homolog [Mizuhopecten yessoensis]|uniref:PQ-loop repeat-containing protein 3 n=1 Tax=Mizuhopecten yessoensis TaxID=6573 RepID=A0A210Q4H1_MIZYE|nr:mannose-P-dolichol utilization defect 1 protein homolog [Mizuhopecten yessoensis]OWF43640.1 PQ-loop repeat-containing protein 3 [Mizuhopecten yessoensis]
MAEISSAVDALCNFLSLTCVVTCLMLKLPQMLAILKSKSTQSLSLVSVLVEECAYSVILSYNFTKGYPLPTYFEYTFLVFQDLILISLMLHYNRKLSIQTLFYFIIYFVFFLCLVNGVLPELILNTAMRGVTGLTMFSKGTQINTLYQRKEPGQISQTSWTIAAYGALVRMLTSSLQTRDAVVFINNTVSASMNITMVGMLIYYKQKPKAKLN